MNQELIDKLQYSNSGELEVYSLPLPLKMALKLTSDFFTSNTNNKLCLVFPSKELAAQWFSIPIVLELIKNDFSLFKDEIYKCYKQYKVGEYLILNNQAIVEWVGIKENGVAFKTKAIQESSGAVITIKFSDVIKLQKAPASRKVLSSIKVVKQALPATILTPLEKILKIDTSGNKEFIKNKICLISKYKLFNDAIINVNMNGNNIVDYFQSGKIDEDGVVDLESPLVISNNLSNLALYLAQSNSIAKIVIDGFASIHERGTDFSDIDAMKIPTILITDLSEMESFEFIGNYGFDFFNFTKENLNFNYYENNSPFHIFNKKLKKYIDFKVIKETCKCPELEIITQSIHSIEKDDSNSELNQIKISLIQLTNYISRISHVLSESETSVLQQKIESIDGQFLKCKLWLGSSVKIIEIIIIQLKSLIEKLAHQPSEKCLRLEELINEKGCNNYIICSTEEETLNLRNYIENSNFSFKPEVLSVADVNDNLLSNRQLKAIIVGWVKSNNMNRILSSFLFNEITVLFYPFENRYFNSLQYRNRKYYENIKSTINRSGIRASSNFEKLYGFEGLCFSNNELMTSDYNGSFDILEHELRLDNAQYERYSAKGNLMESIKAKRVDFGNEYFIYSSESHKFLVINELVDTQNEKVNLYRRRLEALKQGDIIALINTDRDILVELVEKNTKPADLASIKQWTDLWKKLLKEYYSSINNDFKLLVDELRRMGCDKHEATIRAWLQDENRIGPDDNEDLISIGKLTNATTLLENIEKTRESIRTMVGWRMKASKFVVNKIKDQIHLMANELKVNEIILIEGLGNIVILKINHITNTWDNIDIKYVNKLLQKEIL